MMGSPGLAQQSDGPFDLVLLCCGSVGRSRLGGIHGGEFGVVPPVEYVARDLNHYRPGPAVSHAGKRFIQHRGN